MSNNVHRSQEVTIFLLLPTLRWIAPRDGRIRFWQPLKYLLRGNNPRLPGIDHCFLSHIVRAIEYKCTAYL
jgi:hypothetical protein